MLENWHYTVYDDQQQICYFGIMNTEDTLTISDETTRQITINTDLLENFVSDTFVTRDSNLYYYYTYVRFVYPKNIRHCSMHCFFDAEDKCDFFFVVHSYCYLGNFNQPSYAYHVTDWLTTYIYKSIVLHLIIFLYYAFNEYHF